MSPQRRSLVRPADEQRIRKAMRQDGQDGQDGSDGSDGSDAPAGMIAASTPSDQSTLAAGDNTVASFTFVAPSAGVVYVTGQAEFNAAAAGGYITTTLLKDGASLGYADWDAGDVDGYFDQRQHVFAVTAVTAGSHTFALRLNEQASQYSRYYGAQVAVQFVPDSSASVSRSTARRSPNR